MKKIILFLCVCLVFVSCSNAVETTSVDYLNTNLFVERLADSYFWVFIGYWIVGCLAAIYWSEDISSSRQAAIKYGILKSSPTFIQVVATTLFVLSCIY